MMPDSIVAVNPCTTAICSVLAAVFLTSLAVNGLSPQGPSSLQRCPGLTCANGRCINGLDVCNQRDDCGDRSDERNCRTSELLRYCQSAGRENWIWNGGAFCYGVFNAVTSFDSATRQCYSKGSQLVSIHREEESRFLVQTISGLESRDPRLSHPYSYWTGLQEVERGTYEWADGTPLNYENWNVGEPNDPKETCVEMYRLGKWNDAPCGHSKGYICKDLAMPNATKEHCGKPVWLSYNESRYMLVDSQDATWYNAEEACFSYNAQLAVMSSEEELQWITEVLLFKQRGDYSAWIRESTTPYNYSRIEGPLKYSEDLMGVHHCQAIVKDRKARLYGSIETRNCFRRNGFICKDPLSNGLSNNSPCMFPFVHNGKSVSDCVDDSAAGTSWCSLTHNYDNDRRSKPCDIYMCPPGWRSLGRNCYHIPQRLDSWAQGSTSCEYADGSLADITEPRTLSFILNMLKNLNSTVVWVGRQSKRTSNTTFITTATQGSIVAVNNTREYYYYDDDEENGLSMEQDCRAIFTSLPDGSPPELLRVVNCSEAWHFVCVKKASPTRDTGPRIEKYDGLAQGGDASATVYAIAGVGTVVIVLLLLTWIVYGLGRWQRNRGSIGGPAISFSYLKSIIRSPSYNPLEE